MTVDVMRIDEEAPEFLDRIRDGTLSVRDALDLLDSGGKHAGTRTGSTAGGDAGSQ
jgi:hypothetical protein